MFPIFILFFFGCVTSIPIFSSSLFNIGCTQPIYQALDPVQGLRPQTQAHINFGKLFNRQYGEITKIIKKKRTDRQVIGYIHRLDTPTLRLGPDISVHPTNSRSEELPHQAAAILSSIRYDEFNRQLEVRGRISQLNAYRLQRVPNMEGTVMSLRFDTFGSNPLSTDGITGKIVQLTVIPHIKGEQHAELVMELTPEPNLAHTTEYITYAVGGKQTKMDWTGSGKDGCRTYTQVNSRKDRFHETFESAMLL
ncbi:uncharacterized protein EV154DRAFT_301424 [Mucor mucedo]|uniref:uncharacterized protein n=1 Tax=Mucor mucedo TaxID=29922 RepID=UPI00221E5BFA|nr:uncharacterized protein EV154DRAFT_301424 [Mucor mucedo]KAI7888827.1 hypothetical protein EV154DRAFT_301424 [Mucor mucedo]